MASKESTAEGNAYCTHVSCTSQYLILSSVNYKRLRLHLSKLFISPFKPCNKFSFRKGEPIITKEYRFTLNLGAFKWYKLGI